MKKQSNSVTTDEVQHATDMVTFYKCGFIDGVRHSRALPRRKEKKLWREIKEDCRMFFAHRFEKVINNQIRKTGIMENMAR